MNFLTLIINILKKDYYQINVKDQVKPLDDVRKKNVVKKKTNPIFASLNLPIE